MQALTFGGKEIIHYSSVADPPRQLLQKKHAVVGVLSFPPWQVFSKTTRSGWSFLPPWQVFTKNNTP